VGGLNTFGIGSCRSIRSAADWQVQPVALKEHAVDLEDDRPQNMPKPKRDLDPMSIEELQEYIKEMKKEIERVRGEIAKKKAHRAGVEGIFKS